MSTEGERCPLGLVVHAVSSGSRNRPHGDELYIPRAARLQPKARNPNRIRSHLTLRDAFTVGGPSARLYHLIGHGAPIDQCSNTKRRDRTEWIGIEMLAGGTTERSLSLFRATAFSLELKVPFKTRTWTSPPDRTTKSRGRRNRSCASAITAANNRMTAVAAPTLAVRRLMKAPCVKAGRSARPIDLRYCGIERRAGQ